MEAVSGKQCDKVVKGRLQCISRVGRCTRAVEWQSRNRRVDRRSAGVVKSNRSWRGSIERADLDRDGQGISQPDHGSAKAQIGGGNGQRQGSRLVRKNLCGLFIEL